MDASTEKAKQEMNSIEYPNNHSQGLSHVSDEGVITRHFRTTKFFTPYGYDDDSPAFTGKEEALNEAMSFLSRETLENFTLDAYEEEKYWFHLVLTPKTKQREGFYENR
jgi:hypothetical protein